MADEKISELAANADLADTDICVLVDDMGGTPTTKYITGANLKAAILAYLAAQTVTVNNLIIANAGNIGSVGDTDAIAISAGGEVAFSKTAKIGIAATLNSTDAQVYIARECNDDGGMSGTNGHGFSDSTDVDRSGDVGYNSFDAYPDFIGAEDYDHYVAYQARPNVGTSGTIDNVYGYVAYDPGGAGAIANVYGFYCAELDRGTTLNYAFYSAGATPCYFGGDVTLGGNLVLPGRTAASVYQTDVTNQYIPASLAIRVIMQSEAYDVGSCFDNYTLNDTAEAGTDANTLVCAGMLGDVEVGDWIWNKTDNTYHRVTALNDADSVEYEDIAAGDLAQNDEFLIYRCVYTVPATGKYFLSLETTFQLDDGKRLVGFISCNDDATFITRSYIHGSSTNLSSAFLSLVYDLTAADKLSFFIYHDCAAGKQVIDDRQYMAATITRIA